MAAGTDFILDALTREGLNHLFMVPGGLVDPFLPALARHPSLKPIVAAHEGGAAYMADGYARASGRFGAALGIGDPGLRNMATPAAAAKTDSSPVLIAGVSNASLPHPFDLLRKILAKILAWQPLPDALQVQAVAEWGKDGLVEIVVVSGFYQMSRRSIRASTSSRWAACSAVESLDCNGSWSKCLIGA